MKKLFTYLLFFLAGLSLFAAKTENEAELKKQAQQWLKEQPVQFTENKGQMTDMQGKPVPFVLYQVTAPGMNLFVTEKGLTYCFMEDIKDASTGLSVTKDEEEKEPEGLHRGNNKEKNKQGEPYGSIEEDALTTLSTGEEEFKSFNWSRIDMDLEGASIKKENIVTEGKSLMFNQYFLGHCPNGVTDVHTYSKIIIKNVYPGIDWIFYNSNNKGFKYDFEVHPGAVPANIKLLYRSGKKLRFDEQGNIEIKTPYGTLTENAPVSYIKETGESIRTKFVKTNVNSCRPTQVDEGYETSVSFHLLSHISYLTSTLIIDPQLIWSTLLDGAGAQDGGIMDVATDAAGNLFICAYTASGPNAGQNSFPTLNPGGGAYFDGVYAGGFQGFDLVIMKFTSGSVLLWSTFYGGNGFEMPQSMATDNMGNIFVTGRSERVDNVAPFPTYNPAGGAYFSNGFSNKTDVFILKFSNSGIRLWATLYGGGNTDWGNSIVTDNMGNVFVTGWTNSMMTVGNPPQFPTYNPGGGAYFQVPNSSGMMDLFILKFNNTGILLWATCYGGNEDEAGHSIVVDNFGNVFITGVSGVFENPSLNSSSFPIYTPAGTYSQSYGGGSNYAGVFNGDVIILKFSNNGVRLWATFYGGKGNDYGYSIATDCSGNVFITGSTKSTDLPTLSPGGNSYYKSTLSGYSDAFILKFDNNGMRLWATYYGGSSAEYSLGLLPSILARGPAELLTHNNIQTDECGHLFVSFETGSSDIPVQFLSGAYFDGTSNGSNDIYLARFSNTGVLQWGTYFGGNGNDFRSPITLDNVGNLFVGGEWTEFNSAAVSNTTYPLANAGVGTYFNNSFNGGRDDMYIAKLGFKPESSTTLESEQHNPIGCNACNGKVKVTAQCDMPGISYIWSTGRTVLNTAVTSDSISGLCAGNYWVEVTSACGNKDTARFSLSDINCGCSMSASIVENPSIKCFGATGGAIVTVSNGPAGPYTYSWSNGTKAITSSVSNQATNLQAGTYTVTVNTGSCVSVSTIVLSQPTPLLPKITQPVCAANLGTATASASGGFPPYLYTWSTGSTSPTATGLGLGAYSVTITDSKGCASSELTSIYEPMSVSTSSENIACTGYSYAGVTASGPTLYSYTYSWSNGSTVGGNCGNPCLNKNLAAGTYTVTVTDGNGCTVTRSVTITGSSAASATFTSPPVCLNQPSCFTHTGSAGTHSWTIEAPVNVSGTTTNFCTTFLTAGTYSVTHTVTNAGCTNAVTQYINVTNCNSPAITTTGASVCPGVCATITASAVGGAPPYTYLWSNGVTTQNNTPAPCPLVTTTYTVTIKDTGGNTSTSTAVVTVNPAVTVNTTATNISCNGGTNGNANANPTSGTPGFTYSWSNLVSGSTVSGLSAGNYTITLTDSKGCTATSTTAITSPPPLSVLFTKGTANCIGCGCKEWIMINATGGIEPYSYTWPDGYVNRYKNQLCPGTYSINVKDKNGCSVNVNLTAP
ncbi:MAG: SBBP repeat-containing protein [Bacteroidetes bacterium]|nr:SBBP repeat-containing protein [Bacteroidota bacterium]